MIAEVHAVLAIASAFISALLISMLGFAAVMKARDLQGLTRWLADLGLHGGRALPIVLVMLDVMLMGLILLTSIKVAPWWLAASGVILVLLGGTLMRRYAGRPCPCIGGRHGRWTNIFVIAMTLLVGLACGIRIAGVVAPVFTQADWAIFCAAAIGGGGVAIVLDRRVLTGVPVRLSRADISSVWTALPDKVEANGTLIVLFASVSCGGCMRALEQLSAFSPGPHHRIFVDVGRPLPGVASVGGLRVASFEPSVWRLLEVIATPCLLVLRQGQGKRWVGEKQVSNAIATQLKRM